MRPVHHRPQVWVVVALLAAWPAHGQQRVTPDDYYSTYRQARDAYKQSRYDEAAALAARLVDANPQNGDVWLLRARSLSLGGQPRAAVGAYERALELGSGNRAVVALDVARLYARLGDKAACFAWLERALEAKLDRPAIQAEPAFEALRGDAEFARIAGLLPAREFSRDDGWRYDLDFLVAEAQRLDASPERRASSPGFAAAARALRERIPALSDERVAVEMQRLLATLGNGHSVVYPVPTPRVKLAMLPVDFYWFADGVFVVAGEGDGKGLVGSQLVRVGDVGVDRVLRDLEPYVTRDNPMSARWIEPYFLAFPAYLMAVGAAEAPDRATLTLKGKDGAERTVVLSASGGHAPWKLAAPAGAGAPPLYLSRPDANLWMQPLPERSAVYVQYNQVADDGSETIDGFSGKLAGVLASTGASTLVVDVRRNNGGNNFLNAPLVKALVAFEQASPQHRIFVIAGRDTFSAAQNFVNDVERLTHAVFVGEPTGSRPNFAGEDTLFLLPYSGLMGSIASRYFQDSSPTDDRIWIAPQIPVELSSKDYFANADPALDAALRAAAK